MQPLSIVDLYPHTEPSYLQTNLESFLLLRYGVGTLVQSQWVTRVWGYLMQLTCALWSCVDLTLDASLPSCGGLSGPVDFRTWMV